MIALTLADRVAAFRSALPGVPDAWPYVSPSGRWLYGTWEIGNDYRNASGFYGTFPPRFLERLMALFPEAGSDVLHVFSGALPPGPYVRLDLHAFLAWLDTSWPLHRKSQWKTVGRILIQRSTNHRVRVLTLFERAA